MANFYTEVPELKFQLNNPMMERICELRKSADTKIKTNLTTLRKDYTDAMDSYDKRLLENHQEKSPERLSTSNRQKAWTKKVLTVPMVA
ncbi:MAG: hypothetical protein ACLUE2_00500 [Bacteroides cellulosilyticus]